MKKFKLIKIYPYSPELGQLETSFGNDRWNKERYLSEFWEEIVEKEYEILTYKYHTGKDNEIYSIKRLSDGEIFTVGDKINPGLIKWIDNIEKIIIVDNKIILDTGKNGWYNLNSCTKAKQKLFTTEDGVDVFEGDLYWYVNIDMILRKMSNIQNHSINIYTRNGTRIFSIKEKAEEYIIMNKSCLSIQELINLNDTKGASKGLSHCVQQIKKEDLIDLVRKKVGQ